MPTYRVTFRFSGGGEGWSETHLYNSTQTNLDAIFPVMDQIATARAQLLGDPFYVYAVRLSAYLTDAGTRASRGVRIWKGSPGAAWAGWYNNNFGAKTNGSEPSNVAVQAVGFAAATGPAQFLGNSNQTFLGGPPDLVVDNNGSVFPAQLGFGAAFNIWAGILTKPASGWGWGAATQLGDIPCSLIKQNADGTVNFTPVGAVPNTILAGKPYPCRFRDINQGRAALNGEAIVTLNAAGTFDTREVIGIPTAQNRGFCKIYSQVPTFVPYGIVNMSLVTVKHKRGKSPAARPGRSPDRIRG